jgi:hypothetical protein
LDIGNVCWLPSFQANLYYAKIAYLVGLFENRLNARCGTWVDARLVWSKSWTMASLKTMLDGDPFRCAVGIA